MEDSPLGQSWLIEHLVLDLPVDLSGTSFDVKGVSLATSFRSHDHVSSLVLVAFEWSWVVLELEMPQLLFLKALGMSVEDLEKVLALSDFPVSISVNNLS
jgi:hypothetical protein